MKRLNTKLAGVCIIELQSHADERGFYKRLWGREELSSLGLENALNNVGLSYNRRRGTVRGMHYQAEPFAETKVVECARGRIYDIVLDLRQDSSTLGEWIAEELSPDNNRALYIPKGCAHGFQTLEDDSEVIYFISHKWSPEHARGVRWNDPRFEITLPLEVTVINERDRTYPDSTI